MKHTTQNIDGSFTTMDETEDGFFMVLFSWIMAKLVRKAEIKEEEALIAKFPFFCTMCHKRFKTEKKCMSHINKKHIVVKNGKKQIREQVF